MNGEHEGPTTITTQSCFGCKWHGSTMLRSGLDPIYEHYCTHPTWKNDGRNVVWSVQAPKGRRIGRTDQTPTWCPVISSTDRSREGVGKQTTQEGL